MDRTCPTERGLTGQHVNQLVSATLIIPIFTIGKIGKSISKCYLIPSHTGLEDETRHSSVVAVYQESVIAAEYELVRHGLEEDGVLGLVHGPRVQTDQAPSSHQTSRHEHSGSGSGQSTLPHGQAEPWDSGVREYSKPQPSQT